jgi:hypothetical protein
MAHDTMCAQTMDAKIIKNQSVFMKIRKTSLDQFFWFIENWLVAIQKKIETIKQ